MFANLIESNSHTREFKRRSSFFLVTTAAYALILFTAGIASIYAYDAQLEAQTSDLELLNWIPPVTPAVRPDRPEPSRRAPASTNNGRISPQPVRPILYDDPSNPIKPPDQISTAPNPIPPAPPNTKIGNYISDPITPPTSSTDCLTCSGTSRDPVVKIENDTPPPPTPPKPKTETVTSRVLASKAINLPQPPYPPMARQIHVQGSVNVQILVDEQGKVISAQAVSGHPLLTSAAKEAAMRARFTPTLLNGQAVKVQGVITYNFVLQ